MILDGHKTIEVRGSKTTIRGTIGIIKSGTKKVYGTANLFHCAELGEWEFNNIWKQRHQLDITYEELLKIYSKPYAWCLKDIKKLDEPQSYKHKKGCVIWVNI